MRIELVIYLGDVVLAAGTTPGGLAVDPSGRPVVVTFPAQVGLDTGDEWLAGPAVAALAPDRLVPPLRWWENDAVGFVAGHRLSGPEFVALMTAAVRAQFGSQDELTTIEVLVPSTADAQLADRLSFALPDVEVRCRPIALAAAAQAGDVIGRELVVVDWRSGLADVAVVRSDGSGTFDLVPAGCSTLKNAADLATALSAADTQAPGAPWLVIGAADALEAVRRPATAVEARNVVLGVARSAARPKAAERPLEQGVRTDDDVQFTVYRPRAVRPDTWEQLIAFAHKTEKYEESGRTIDPLVEVAQQVAAVLGQDASRYLPVGHDSDLPLPRGGTLRFVPDVAGVEFSPTVREFRWLRGVHREEFLFRAGPQLEGSVARGSVAVFLGTTLIADVRLAIRIDAARADATPEPEHASAYRKIFPSYSHLDASIVDNVATVVAAFGDEFMRDVDRLRSGQVWNDELARFIREADVFQLYWSSHSMLSAFVHEEWQYALSLGRPGFIRPVFWEQPRPTAPDRGLPPPELDRIHFSFMPLPGRPAPPSEPDSVPPGSSTPDGVGISPTNGWQSESQHRPEAPPETTTTPKRRGRIVTATGTLAVVAGAAIAISVANSSTSPLARGRSAESSLAAPPLPISSHPTLPDATLLQADFSGDFRHDDNLIPLDRGRSRRVARDFVDYLARRDVEAARPLVCASGRSLFDLAAGRSNGLLAVDWTSAAQLSRPFTTGGIFVFEYAASAENGGRLSVSVVVADETGPHVCAVRVTGG